MNNYHRVYGEIKEALADLPVTWYPALIQTICHAAQEKNVFLPGGMTAIVRKLERERCAATHDGEDCSLKNCPQLRDGEPGLSGRSCPLAFLGSKRKP